MPEGVALSAENSSLESAPTALTAKTGRQHLASITLLALALGIETTLLYIVSLGNLRSQVPAFWLGIFPAFALYAFAAWWVLRHPQGSTRLILLTALFFRLTMWFSSPTLSDDIYRYVWDGRVQVAGINPYLYAPDAPELTPLRNALHAQVNHAEIPTIYPPLAQLFFWLIVSISESVKAIKLGLIACDMTLCLLLVLLLKKRGQDPRRALLYAWHPLPLIEVAGSGHIDVLGTSLLMLCLYYANTARKSLASSALAAAFLAKLIPALLLPALWKQFALPQKTSLCSWLSPAGRLPLLYFPLFCLIGYLPFAEIGTDLFAGLGTYLRHWHFNDLAYSALRTGLQIWDPGAALHARWLCTTLLFAIVIYALKYQADPLRTAFWLMGAYTLLSPTLHPWYLLWVLPFMPFFVHAAWVLLCALVFLAYEVLIDCSLTGIWSEKNWVKWAQYAPFYFLLCAAYLRDRLGRNPESAKSI
jgi:hypothetical protein